MKNKEFYPGTSLPVYEVTELTMEEALFALSTHRGNRANLGILSEEVLRAEYHQHPTAHQCRH
ncbi:MAG: hypothetical protein GY753_05525 [Gammaproteobacteria bacterium]|nr:hypothetical protein [Gammaproteobacteria bacterium]